MNVSGTPLMATSVIKEATDRAIVGDRVRRGSNRANLIMATRIGAIAATKVGRGLLIGLLDGFPNCSHTDYSLAERTRWADQGAQTRRGW